MSSTKADQFIAVRLPEDLALKLKDAVRKEDTDKSKLIRSAIRRHLRELGYEETVTAGTRSRRATA